MELVHDVGAPSEARSSRRVSMLKLLIGAIATFVGLFALSSPASAQTALCTATTIVTDGAELDAAIDCYNAQTPAGDHTITLGDDLLFDADNPGAPVIDSTTNTGTLTLDGAGFTITGPRGPDGSMGPNNADFIHVIEVNNPGAETEVTNMTINGANASAIRVDDGTVTITSTIIHHNRFGGFGVTGGRVTIDGATIRDNGDLGIVTIGATVVTINDATIHNNDGSGVIVLDGTATITNTTIHQNDDAGIDVVGGTVTVSNTTIHDNVSEAIFVQGGVATLVSSIVSASSSGAACGGVDASEIDGGNNFVAGTGCPAGFTVLTIGSLATGLADNGCVAAGCTQTIALLAGSNAIGGGLCTGLTDASGNPIILTFDQRGDGFPRTSGTDCDAGAYELLEVCTAIAVNGETAISVATAAELDAAIDCYNAQTPAGDHTITLGDDLLFDADNPGASVIDSTTNTGTLTLDGAGFTITGPRGPDGTGPDIPGFIHVIEVNNPDAETEIANITINGADASAVQVDGGAVAISNTTTHHNSVGGVGVTGGTASIDGATIHDNRAGGIGGTGGTTTITNTTIHNNDRDGIFVSGGTATITNTTIHNNDRDGIFVSGGTTTVTNTTIHDNSSDGIRVFDGTVAITNTTIRDNRGTFSSDGIFVSGGIATVTNTTIYNNRRYGIFVVGGSTTVTNATIHDNDSTGIIVAVGATVNMVSSIVSAPAAGTACIVGPIDGGNNFVLGSGCPAGFTVLTAGSLGAGLADNGCTEIGCTQTVALLAGSNAVGAGLCDGLTDASGNPIITTFDQRGDGFARTINIGCDAGAFEVDCTNPFADVPGGQFFTDPVIWAACNGVTTGTATGPPPLFSPGGPVTRAQMATFLWRYAGRPTPTGAPHGFTDVPDGQFYSIPIQWLSEEGITTGTGDGTTFSPNSTVTRAQMATFLWRFQGEPTAPDHTFTDVPNGIFYDIPVAWLSNTAITTGTGDGTTYSPNLTLTRAQAVTFLHRLELFLLN